MDLDPKTMTVQSSTLMPRRHIGQSVCGFEGEALEYFHNPIVAMLVLAVVLSHDAPRNWVARIWNLMKVRIPDRRFMAFPYSPRSNESS